MTHTTEIHALDAIFQAARAAGRSLLLETEGLAVVRTLGLDVPAQLLVEGAAAAARADLAALPSDQVVVKVVSPEILHKSDVGGVVVVPKKRSAVVAAVAAMEGKLTGREIAGFSLNEHVPYDAALGGELLLGLRWTEDFGPVLTLGPGGIYAEHLAEHLRSGRGAAVLSPALRTAGRLTPSGLAELLAARAIAPAVTGRLRGRRARLAMPRLLEIVEAFFDLAEHSMPHDLLELEVNPLALTDSGPVALDALVRLADGEAPAASPGRPIEKIGRLLRPRSIAVIGVSRTRNPGRMILENILRMGFERERVFVVKPGTDSIDGCRCYADIASLPDRVDLLVVAIDATRVPALLDEVLASRKAESLILIPGGLGEKSGSEVYAARLRTSLAKAREGGDGGPVVNGGNCLGIRSLPGRYNTLFIPPHKLCLPPDGSRRGAPLALLSQSGAFAIARASRLEHLDPRYLITLGNQVDLTVGDYLTYLTDETEVEVFACYVEGFQPLDGRRFLDAAAALTAAGRPVILYRAGRTPAGARASASHTASIAGDYTVTRELARAAGVVVAETPSDFEDLVRTFCYLRDRRVGGNRLGALSNAGFECVAVADHLEGFRLATLGEATCRGLRGILEGSRLETIVEVGNPFDTTPILDDEAFTRAARLILDDDGVDVGVVGCVPLTGALNTVAAGPGHSEDVLRHDSVVRRLARLRTEVSKAWVAVVDSGPLYDPIVDLLEEHEVPTFGTAGRALRALRSFCRWRTCQEAAGNHTGHLARCSS